MQRQETNGEWQGLWEQYGPRLLLFARQQTAHDGDAEDLVQEAFVKYWRARRKQPALPPTLMFRMVKRTAIDRARKAQGREQRERESQLLAGEPTTWFAHPVEDQERQEQIDSALRALPAHQREVLVLKVWSDLTFEQIGETLDLSPNTAASRYRYALNQLRKILTPAVV